MITHIIDFCLFHYFNDIDVEGLLKLSFCILIYLSQHIIVADDDSFVMRDIDATTLQLFVNQGKIDGTICDMFGLSNFFLLDIYKSCEVTRKTNQI